MQLLSQLNDDFDFQLLPRKLNLGCGFDIRPDYLNIDLHEVHNPDLVADVARLGKLPSDFYEEILASDILEHLPRSDTRHVLVHWNRLLKMGGILRLRVPSILGLADLLRSPTMQSLDKQEQLVQCLFGTQAYSGDFHCTAFTEVVLREYLAQCGYGRIEIVIKDSWLFDVTAVKGKNVSPRNIEDYADLLEIEDDATFVEASFQQILGRDPDDGGKSFFLEGLSSGRIQRGMIHVMMLNSDEYLRRKKKKK
jgi:predicted SAM-dependent methyltransferase